MSNEQEHILNVQGVVHKDGYVYIYGTPPDGCGHLPDKHNCDQMSCPSCRPHLMIVAKVTVDGYGLEGGDK